MSRCIAPIDDDGERLCGAPATEERTVEGLVMSLCGEHAAELDEEEDDGIDRRGAEAAGESN